MYSLDIPINRYMCDILCVLENYKYARMAARRGEAHLVTGVCVYTVKKKITHLL